MLDNYKIKNGVVYFNSEMMADGYSEEESRKVDEYRKVLLLRKKGLSITKIASSLKIPRSRVAGWICQHKKPDAIRAIELAGRKGWLPINTNSKKFETILDIFSWIYGDGHLHKDGYVMMSGQRKDLEKIGRKISENLKLEYGMSKCGFNSPNKETYNLYLRKGCRIFGRLLMSLEAPIGNKVYSKFLIPNWVTKSNFNVKKRFLEVFFSNEITVRKINLKGYAPKFEIRINKSKSYIQSGLLFMSQIKRILKEFNICSWSPKVSNHQSGNFCISLVVAGDLINIYKFYNTFNLQYSSKKQKSLEKVGIAVERKLKKHLQDIKNYKSAMKLRKQGLGRRKVSKMLNLNTNLVDGWFRRSNKPIFCSKENELEKLLFGG